LVFSFPFGLSFPSEFLFLQSLAISVGIKLAKGNKASLVTQILEHARIQNENNTRNQLNTEITELLREEEEIIKTIESYKKYKREVEEAKREAEEAKREVEEAKRDAEEAKREAEEAKREAEESKRRNDQYKKETEANNLLTEKMLKGLELRG
jgi:Spy/CpxP family protein refolding chaperone